jgi:hypothetical protein
VHALEFLKYILIVLLIFHGKFKWKQSTNN